MKPAGLSTSHATSQLGADLHLRARARELVAQHKDPTRPGRPLFAIFAGTALSLLSFGAAVYVAYATWYAGSLQLNAGLAWLAAIFVVHAAGVVLFSYSYEAYDARKALKLAFIILVAAAGAIVVIAVALAIFAALRDDDAAGAVLGPASKALGGLAEFALDSGIDLIPGTEGDAAGSVVAGGLSPARAQSWHQGESSLFPEGEVPAGLQRDLTEGLAMGEELVVRQQNDGSASPEGLSPALEEIARLRSAADGRAIDSGIHPW